jgi:cytochrome c-type biogenesis protein CcmH/NrfG
MIDSAVPLLQQAVHADPNNPSFLYHLAMAYYSQRRNDEARTLLERALQPGSNFRGAEEARTTLARIRD